MWPVYGGRRDGRESLASEAWRDLPCGGANFTTLHNLFARFGLDDTDLVALSGKKEKIKNFYYFSSILFFNTRKRYLITNWFPTKNEQVILN